MRSGGGEKEKEEGNSDLQLLSKELDSGD